VDEKDLHILIRQIFEPVALQAGADINGDQSVSAADVTDLLKHWHSASAAVRSDRRRTHGRRAPR